MYMYIYIYILMRTAVLYIYMYIYSSYDERISEDKVLNIVNVELSQLKLHLLPHVVTLRFTYADDDNDLQTGDRT